MSRYLLAFIFNLPNLDRFLLSLLSAKIVLMTQSRLSETENTFVEAHLASTEVSPAFHPEWRRFDEFDRDGNQKLTLL